MSEEIVNQAIEYLKSNVIKRYNVFNIAKIKQLMFLEMSRLDIEVFKVVYIDVNNFVVDIVELSRGTTHKNKIYPREIVKYAILLGAIKIILVHNHPSGKNHASKQDIEITKRLKDILDDLDIEVYDHLIISTSDVISLRDKKLI